MENNLEKNPFDSMLLEALDYYFGFIFITDGKGDVLYINKRAAESMGTSMEELSTLNVNDLERIGMVSKSVCVEVIQSRKKATRIITYPRTGQTIVVVCIPIFNETGELSMTVAFSQSEAEISNVLRDIEREKCLAKETINYMSNIQPDVFPIIAESATSKKVFEYASMVSDTNIPVLLYGESGTGKEVTARFIHKNSDRSRGPFLAINCAAIPHGLFEAEFFGYAKGAFTGAKKEGKAGIFEMANGGTLFMDELGEMPLDMQTKLLRALDNGTFIHVGSTAEQKSDVRIIAATNRDLRAMVANGEFREDLYYRISVIPIRMPPLRERPEDIIALSNMFLNAYNRKYRKNARFSDDTIRIFFDYSWPGNIRELKNIIERMIITSDSDELNVMDDMPSDRPKIILESMNDNKSDETYQGESLKSQMTYYERKIIEQAIDYCGGNIEAAADKLGISRSGLYQKLKKP
ncbi:MAG: sigma-54 interaction domain-containing protein [Lachnospiraceae bacterium]|jgi:transcriptional regulator with PAS, ATPase and Fis domain